MKRLIIGLGLFALLNMGLANAVEITANGTGYALLTGYDIKATRAQEDEYMSGKSHNAKTELMHSQQIKEATRQANNRKKQDTKMNATLRGAVVTLAQENADKEAINMLVNRVLGANATNNPEVQAKLNELYSQSGTYILDKNYTGEVIDNRYVAKVQITVDDSEFRELISDLGIALNTATVRKSGMLLVLDEFFAAPSDMNANVLTKEITRYDYKYNEKDKETTKLSAKDSSSNKSASGYSGYYGTSGHKNVSSSNSSLNYGNYVDYSKNESEFFENIKEYAPKSPTVSGMNYTYSALGKAFTTYDIRTIDNDIFKSKYFKGQYVTADKLGNSEALANYVNFAKTDAKADFFAIGVSYIIDTGINQNTGKHTCDGNVYVKVYSTQDGELITSGALSETASGNSADQARVAVANKVAKNLGDELSKSIQNYWKRRTMYGSEYIIEVKGRFLPAERISISNALKSTEGVKNVSTRTVDTDKVEYVLNYSGSEPLGDSIFMNLVNSSSKFNNYDYKLNSNQIIFVPLKGENL